MHNNSYSFSKRVLMNSLIDNHTWFFQCIFYFLKFNEKLAMRRVNKKIKKYIDEVCSKYLRELSPNISPIIRYTVDRNMFILKKINHKIYKIYYDEDTNEYILCYHKWILCEKSYCNGKRGSMEFHLKSNYITKTSIKELLKRKIDPGLVICEYIKTIITDPETNFDYYCKNVRKYVNLLLNNNKYMVNIYYNLMKMWIDDIDKVNGEYTYNRIADIRNDKWEEVMWFFFKCYGRKVNFSEFINDDEKLSLIDYVKTDKFKKIKKKLIHCMDFFTNYKW